MIPPTIRTWHMMHESGQLHTLTYVILIFTILDMNFWSSELFLKLWWMENLQKFLGH